MRQILLGLVGTLTFAGIAASPGCSNDYGSTAGMGGSANQSGAGS